METVAPGHTADASIDSFIAKRDEQRRAQEGERPAEALYAESCNRHEERLRQRRTWDWVRYHEAQAEVVERNAAVIAAGHRAKANALLLELEGRNNGHRKGAA